MSDMQAGERGQLRVRRGTVAYRTGAFIVYLIAFCSLHWQKQL